MTTDERCIGCDRSVAAGTAEFASRVRHGDGFLCADCADVLGGGGSGDARVLERIRQYGLGSAGGRTGGLGGGPG